MIFPELIYKIRGIAFDIFNAIAGNWPEEKYENIFYDVLKELALNPLRQKEFEIVYKEHRVGLFRTDVIVDNKVVIEFKVAPEILPLHQAQVLSYLKVTGLPIGLLINFGASKLFIKAFPNNISKRKILSIPHDLSKSLLPEKAKKEISVFLTITKEIMKYLVLVFFIKCIDEHFTMN